MAKEELKWQNIDADDLPAAVKKSFDAMVEAEGTFKADLEKLLKAEGYMPEDKFLVMSRKGTMSEDWPEAPIMLAKLPRAPVCCFTASTSFCAPPGCAATPLRPASSPGIAAPIAVCVLLRSRPSADAMRPIISGVRNCIMSETRLTAMGLLLCH